MADVKVNINNKAIENLNKQLLIALEQTADQLLTDVITDQKMPFDTGNMQNNQTQVDSSELKDGKVTIVTSVPQARRLYFHPEYNFQRNKNANAGGRWWDEYLTGTKKHLPSELFSKLAKRRLSK
jgi:hypothetical protein